ncbi:MAG TPA: Uma2 family endonuclease [Thermoanaerobaculia bacterium]|jgi:Uma2 family endonuclease
MSQPAVSALAPLPFELVYSDGEPLESEWHTVQIPLLKEVIRQAMAERGQSDFFVGGNMFVYYSVEQAWDVARGKPYFRGPDVFWVGGVEPKGFRKAWVSWEEGGRLPEVIVELLSPSTEEIDRTVKKDIYARIFRTPEYYLCESQGRGLEGFELAGLAYRPMAPDEQGRFWSQQLGAFLGLWHGVMEGKEGDFVRLFRADGSLVPTKAEAERQRVEAANQRAEAANQRAEAAEAELARLRALLEGRGQD